MPNPFRSEGEAYHFLILTVLAFSAITTASLLGGVWAGVPVWVVATATAAFFYLRRGRSVRLVKTAPPHVPDERRVLVVGTVSLGDETVGVEKLVEEIERAATGYRTKVRVVCPMPVSPIRHWTSDVDGARRRVKERLNESLARLRARGVEAHGEVGDEDPLQAIEDALRTFGADEIIVLTDPGKPPTWLDGGVVAEARERFALPIKHVAIGNRAHVQM